MNHFEFDISLACLIPGLILCAYVLYKDKIEPEPIGLLALLFGAGAVCAVGSHFLEKFLVWVLDTCFASGMEYMENGSLEYASEFIGVLHQGLCAFAGISLSQVALKWGAMFLLTHKHKAFNYLYDGVVYSTVLSLGFALSECCIFWIANGTQLLGVKLLTAVPGHLFVGILMGWLYTMWRVRFLANRIEEKMLQQRIILQDNIRPSGIWLVCSILIPIVMQGLFLLAGNIRSDALTTVVTTLVFAAYGISFVLIDSLAGKDRNSKRYLCRVIARSHPDLSIQRIEKIVSAGKKGGRNG